jgi:hypothetical protein
MKWLLTPVTMMHALQLGQGPQVLHVHRLRLRLHFHLTMLH